MAALHYFWSYKPSKQKLLPLAKFLLVINLLEDRNWSWSEGIGCTFLVYIPLGWGGRCFLVYNHASIKDPTCKRVSAFEEPKASMVREWINEWIVMDLGGGGAVNGDYIIQHPIACVYHFVFYFKRNRELLMHFNQMEWYDLFIF